MLSWRKNLGRHAPSGRLLVGTGGNFASAGVVVTRSDAIGVLSGIVVAPVTRTVRNMPTEICLGSDEGLNETCVASFDNLQRLQRSALRVKIGDLGLRSMEICEALRAMTDC